MSPQKDPAPTVQWLLQGNHPNLTTVREMTSILLELGHHVKLVDLKGRSNEIPPIPNLNDEVPCVCYGPSFIPRALQHPILRNGVFFDPSTFQWSAFKEGWGSRMISDGAIVALKNVKEALRGAPAFVRPDEDSKAFDGGVFNANTFADVLRKLDGRVSNETPVVVAPPVQINAEWRTFIVGQEVVGASSYRVGREPNISSRVPHAVIDLAFDAAAAWSPADVFCLDIALSEGRYGIVEANCFNASRFYGADAKAIIAAVSQAMAR